VEWTESKVRERGRGEMEEGLGKGEEGGEGGMTTGKT